MDPKVEEELQQEAPSTFHQQVLEDTRALVSISRRKMTEYYPQWDKNDDTYRTIRQRDKTDILAYERGEPEKQIVPTAYSQIQTFIAFCYSLYMQRDRFFELEGFTPEDDRPAKIGEALLARDLSHNCWESLLYQFLLDIGRFGVGILKVHWVTEKGMQTIHKTIPAPKMFGMRLGTDRVETTEEFGVQYEGNKIISVSPYRFFPDVRLPFVRFQEGEFCASEDIYTVSQLKRWEQEGEIAGVDHIKPLGKDIAQDRGYRWDTGLDPGGALTQGAGIKGDGQTKKTVIITECQRTIIPSQYEIDGKPMGEEDYPIKYNIWIANDNRVVKCEPLGYAHDRFTYIAAPFVFDNNTLLSAGLSDIIDQLQNVMSWLFNSRVTNVRKVIGDKLIVNPAMVNMADVQNRTPIIRLTAAAAGDVDKYVKQLQLVDVTANHISKDVKEVFDILKTTSGITDSLLGEVRPGRRTATENRNTTTGAATRQKTIAAIIFRFALEDLGRQMLSNLRNGLDNETYVKVMGLKGMAVPEFVPVDKNSLVGHYDFEIFDGTLPSERFHSAQALEDLLQFFMGNPQAAVMFNIDPRKLLHEVLLLRGIHNPERFDLQIQNVNLGGAAAVGAAMGGGAGGPPTEAAGPNGGQAPGVPGALPEPLLSPPIGATNGGGNGGGFAGVPGRF